MQNRAAMMMEMVPCMMSMMLMCMIWRACYSGRLSTIAA